MSDQCDGDQCIPKLSKGGVEGVSSQRCQLSPLTDRHSLLTPRKAHANEYHCTQNKDVTVYNSEAISDAV